MKRVVASIVLSVVLVSLLFAGVFKDKPTAVSNGSDITVSWITLDESNVQRFDVLRRAGYSGDFLVIASVNPKGNNSSYHFVDQQAFKVAAGIYQYKIRVVNGELPPPESEIVTVSHLSSTAKRTWGSIKAMFR
ncbi:MAG TPA: hypothetical protein VNN76_00490 [Bacteroidota bacterium]|nr:hypothetical protein [Bacteroidota bacterium]